MAIREKRKNGENIAILTMLCPRENYEAEKIATFFQMIIRVTPLLLLDIIILSGGDTSFCSRQLYIKRGNHRKIL